MDIKLRFLIIIRFIPHIYIVHSIWMKFRFYLIQRYEETRQSIMICPTIQLLIKYQLKMKIGFLKLECIKGHRIYAIVYFLQFLFISVYISRAGKRQNNCRQFSYRRKIACVSFLIDK